LLLAEVQMTLARLGVAKSARRPGGQEVGFAVLGPYLQTKIELTASLFELVHRQRFFRASIMRPRLPLASAEISSNREQCHDQRDYQDFAPAPMEPSS
jgi:hypothetical protein